MAVSSAIDVLALANYVSQKELYHWYSLSETAKPVRGMNGFSINPDYTIHDAPDINLAVVCTGINGKQPSSKKMLAWLRRLFAGGCQVGSISTGTWTLAEAGLLDGRRCTVHWEDLSAFKEMRPDLKVTSEIFEIDKRIFTCSGGTAAVDLFLSFVTARHGITLAHAVAAQLVHQNIRTPNQVQREKLSIRLGINHKNVSKAIDLMQKNIESTVSIATICQYIGLSERHLERLFRKLLGQTPQGFYRTLRLQQAQSLLKGTSRPVYEIAYATGFNTSSYFAKCYKQHFGYLPARERNEMK